MSKMKLHIALLLLLLAGCSFQKPDYLKLVNAAELKQILQTQDIFLVDVHTPEQKHIKGTDLFVPYDQIEKYQAKFPTDKNTAIYLYCRSGRMANTAAKSLYGLGYHNLTNLDGGTEAWQKNGFTLE